MTREELMEQLEVLPRNAEILVDIGERRAEIRKVEVEYSQRPHERKPYVIIEIYRQEEQ